MNRRTYLLGGGAIALGAAALATTSVLQMGSEEGHRAAARAQRAPLPDAPELEELVRYATLAANGHNTQPWKFQLGRGQIAIWPDFSRRTPAVDPDDHHLFFSLGCAAENLSLSAAARGRPGATHFDARDGGHVVFEFIEGARAHSTLFDAIPRRQSTRADFDGRAVGSAELEILADVVPASQGVALELVTDRAKIERIRDLVVAGNDVQMADRAFVSELRRWLRFNPRQAMETGDGLFVGTTGNPSMPTWLGRSMFELAFRAAAEDDKYASQLRTSSGVAVFFAEQASPEHWVRAGQACQRFALQATALGMKLSFVNQPVEVGGLRKELSALVGMKDRRPDAVLRFGYGPSLPYALRRPVGSVVV
ncbi:Nitroreductase family protein [Variovorax sp. HW608]|uniref:Acg family FMN-binding oxidoreductase n=1 Tax=Variovorax sp. HW608 TaxID=1034889 RepID=UPI00082022BA|nr:nitroreductase family protein [Variovorax sp. HW608]SCK21487.1 Nitroreductase family protein [Variovorax sp. HW608]